MRIGFSSDTHKFCEGNHIMVGGVSIPYTKGIEAHSDGDALCHAIGEAMLGALALGDLGSHFPDTDPKYAGISSLDIVRKVLQLVKDKGYAVGNIDTMICIETPKMAPHIEAMRRNLADVLDTSISNISIKATRGEGIGFVGRGEGILCQCSLLLKEEKPNE